MRLAKTLTLIAAALLWLIVAVMALLASFPLWGMSAEDRLPGWMPVAFALWIGTYLLLVIWLVRLKKYP